MSSPIRTDLEPLIFERSHYQGGGGVPKSYLPDSDVPNRPVEALLPAGLLAEKPPMLPDVGELDAVRHFTRLSQMNFSVDTNFYPLGSCTMKYNPKTCDQLSILPGFRWTHPYQPDETVQGILEILHDTEQSLCQISGMDAVSLHPAAGAHGELTALLVIKAYHASRGEKRTKVLIPDSAHGTNPASCTIAGEDTVQLVSNRDGQVDLDDLKSKLGPDVACLMLTNPNTLGVFEKNILKVAEMLHEAGALLYMDGANLNALLGKTRPGDFGVDVLHFNLHKTFAVPHGGGGPGAGPIGVKSHLEPFLPVPRVMKEGRKYRLVREDGRPRTIGQLRSFYGSTGALIRAYIYIRSLGPQGLKDIAENAVLNANYLLSRLKDAYDLGYQGHAMHEFVLSADRQKAKGVRALDIAKRLLELGYHAPTIYFPLIVHEAIMIEPTETESKQTLDEFAEALLRIAKDVDEDPTRITAAPRNMPVTRLDEVGAARNPILRWIPPAAGQAS